MITNFLFLGRILNRFSQDTGLVDDNLPDVIFEINTVRIIKLLNEMKLNPMISGDYTIYSGEQSNLM